MEKNEPSVAQSYLVVSGSKGRYQSVNHIRNLVKQETKTTFKNSVMHYGESKEKKGNFWGPGIVKVQPESLEIHQDGMIRSFDRFLSGIADKYRRMAENLSIEARESGTSDKGMEIFEQFLKEFDERVRPVMKDNISLVSSLVSEVRQTASFYGDINTTKKEINKLIDKGKNIDQAIEIHYRTNISPMGIMTQGDITGFMLDSLWSIFDSIPSQYTTFIAMLSIHNIMSSGISSFATHRGLDRIQKLRLDKVSEESGMGSTTFSYTALGDEQENWINQLLIHAHKEISSKHLHAIMLNEYTTVLGSQAIPNYNYIQKVLNTRPTIYIKKRFLQRFSSERPSHVGSAQADRWLRPSYVRVKIPTPEHDDLKDIKPGKRPSSYKYVWGIRIVVGGPSKGPTSGAAIVGERGYNKRLIRHMDTFRSDLLVNLYIKTEGKKKITDRPWETASSEFKLLQLAYKPPDEAKIYRLMSPLTVLKTAVDFVREGVLKREWEKSGIESIGGIEGPDPVIAFKMYLFITFVRLSLIRGMREFISDREYSAMINKIRSVFLNIYPGIEKTILNRRLNFVLQLAEDMIEQEKLDQLVPNSSLLMITKPIGLVKFMQSCKNRMWKIMRIYPQEATEFKLEPERIKRIHPFIFRNLRNAFSNLLEYQVTSIAKEVHKRAISVPVGKTQEDLFVKVPKDQNTIFADMIYSGNGTQKEAELTSVTPEEEYDIIMTKKLDEKYSRILSVDTKYFAKSGMEDVQFPIGKGKLNATDKDYVPFRHIAPTNPPPVIIVLFDSGAPDAREIQKDLLKDKNFYNEFPGFFRNDYRQFPTKYWKNSDDGVISIENMPMSYDVEYDVDGYVDLDLSTSPDDYVYDIKEMREDAENLSQEDEDMKMTEAVEFLEQKENQYIYIPHRSETIKGSSEENPYFNLASRRKRGIATRSASIAFCDVRSLIGRSSLGGVLHFNGRNIFESAETTAEEGSQEETKKIPGFHDVPEIRGLFQHLQWPASRIFDPMLFGKGKGGRLHVEVIAKYDNGTRWSPGILDEVEFAKENWNRMESWGLAKGSRRQVDLPLPPIIEGGLDEKNYWAIIHYEKSFPGVFKHLDEIDIYRWRRIAEKSGVGAIPKLKEDLKDDKTKLIAYCAPRFLPREVKTYPSGSTEEQWRKYINSSDDTPTDSKQFLKLPVSREEREMMQQFEMMMGRIPEMPMEPSATIDPEAQINVSPSKGELPERVVPNIQTENIESNPLDQSQVEQYLFIPRESDSNATVSPDFIDLSKYMGLS